MRPHSSTWETEGFKGLVTCTKCNHDSYGSKLGFSSTYISILVSSVSFTRARANLGVGVFIRAKIVPFYNASMLDL